MHSGCQNNQDLSSPWVDAFISQTAVVPADTLSLRLLAQGPFTVFANGTPISMSSLGGNQYGGDLSAFAGALTELKLVNVSAPGNLNVPPTIVDNITLSPTAVPEPGTITFLALGLAAYFGLKRRPVRRG